MRNAIDCLKNNTERITASRYINTKQKSILAIEDYIRTHETNFSPDAESLFKAIESVLGFELYAWQKSYIITGEFRRSGKTTAECLQILLDNKNKPLDLSHRPASAREDFERRQLREIQIKLNEAGIKTRIIFWNIQEKERYLRGNGINKHLEEEAKQIAESFPCFRV